MTSCSIDNIDGITRVGVCTAGVARTEAADYQVTSGAPVDPFAPSNTGTNLQLFRAPEGSARIGNFRNTDLANIGSNSLATGFQTQATGVDP